MDEQEKWYAYNNDFTECVSYTEDDILDVTAAGISLKDGAFIEFKACAEQFKKMHPGSSGGCVGERMSPVFFFYTQPNPTKLTFLHKSKIREYFSPTRNRVFALQKKIDQYGYQTYDMS